MSLHRTHGPRAMVLLVCVGLLSVSGPQSAAKALPAGDQTGRAPASPASAKPVNPADGVLTVTENHLARAFALLHVACASDTARIVIYASLQ